MWIANFSQIFAVKLLANYGSCFHCYILFWTCRTFYISLEVFYYNWPQSKAVNNVLTSCINNVIFTLISNELIKVADLRKLPNEWRTGDRNGKHFFQGKQEKDWSFDKVRNVLRKNYIYIYIYIYIRYISIYLIYIVYIY